jgi:hypothetical protein
MLVKIFLIPVVVKVDGDFQNRKIMRSTYDRYAETIQSPIGYGTFVKLKPKNVLPFTDHIFIVTRSPE